MMRDFEREVKPIESDRSCPHCGDRQLERVSNALWRCETCSATFPIAVMSSVDRPVTTDVFERNPETTRQKTTAGL
jgi:ribosomal protein L37AE/L43A